MSDKTLILAEPNKQESSAAKGVAILAMVMLHLFCRMGELPYIPFIYIGETPLIYYLGLWGGMCVPIYCFLSGYAQCLIYEKQSKGFFKSSLKRILSLYCNYLVVVVLFSVVGLIIGTKGIPGSLSNFLGNALIFGMNYNGAWWFLRIYILLVFLSPLIVKIINKCPGFIVFLVSGIIYFAGHVLRYVYIIEISNPLLSWLYEQVILLANTQFSFIIGMLFYRNKWISRLKYAIQQHKAVIFAVFGITAVSLLANCIEQSSILSPVIGITSLISFYVFPRPKFMNKLWLFLGNHSTNIWLTHMFFYASLFPNLVFEAKYPVFVLLFMLLLCVGASYFIKLIMYLPKKIKACKNAG